MPNIRDSNSSAPEFPSEGWIGTLLVLALGGLQHLKLICQQRCQMNQPLPLCQEYLLTQEMLIVIEMPKYISFSGHTLFESELTDSLLFTNLKYIVKKNAYTDLNFSKLDKRFAIKLRLYAGDFGNMAENRRDVNFVTRTFDRSPSKSRYLVGVIDDGTSTVSFSIYTTPEFKEIASHQLSVPMISPKPGWYEQDAMAVINNMYRCIEISMGMLASLGYKKEDLVTIGITNQRETTIMWDAITGKPLHNAIVWNDIRTSSTVDQIVAHIPEKDINHFKDKCGLPISPYFPALKIRWLMENVPAIQRACKENRCKAGTIDSWIIWHLTKGGLHITDVTNASRTLLMNISTLQWDHTLLKAFCIRVEMLPQIRSSSEIYGIVTDERTSLLGIKISGILGNQQASLLGQMCIKPGQAKNTYRAGCFLLCNTGHVPVISRHGLLTTVAYKLGSNNPATYALEGAVAVAGHALEWLEHQVRILPRAEDAEKYAAAVPTTGDVYFVPAFTGLYAPYWRKDARGLIVGLTQFSTKHHIIRAALEAICFQTRDILEIMYKETEQEIDKLYADGQLSKNNLLMQLQADTVGIPVFRSQLFDCAPFGVAMCAAQAHGIDLCRFDPDKKEYFNVFYDQFIPASTDEERKHRYGKWKRAVQRSFDWAIPTNLNVGPDIIRPTKIYVMPLSLFVFISFAMIIHSWK